MGEMTRPGEDGMAAARDRTMSDARGATIVSAVILLAAFLVLHLMRDDRGATIDERLGKVEGLLNRAEATAKEIEPMLARARALENSEQERLAEDEEIRRIFRLETGGNPCRAGAASWRITKRDWELTIEWTAEVRNEGNSKYRCEVEGNLLDPQGYFIAGTTASGDWLAPGGMRKVTSEIRGNPELLGRVSSIEARATWPE